MEKDNKDQQLDQLLRGVSGLCASKEDCTECPFHSSACFFGEPKPRTWFGNETEPAKVKEEIKKLGLDYEEDVQGTWLVSTTMGTVFSKYVFICSKCGYKKESFLSVAPTANCPECEKNRLNGSV